MAAHDCMKFIFILNAWICISSFTPKALAAVFPEIVGEPAFKQQVATALQLLQDKAPHVLKFINQYNKRIQQFEKSGMCVWCNPPTYQLAFAPGNMEKYWLASTIAHDSYHSYLYQHYRAALGTEPDYNLFSGFDAERQCNAYQMKVLKDLQAPQYIIEHMKKQDGTHCDLNGDGVCDDKDYNLRNYRR